MKRTFWIDVHYAAFGVESEGDMVIAAAPIVYWMKGKRLQEIKPWLIKKKARAIEIKT